MRQLLFFILFCNQCLAQSIHPNAHAHNDYAHTRPLFDALNNGFTSIEADIYLKDGSLLVAHDVEDLPKAKSLEKLYLHPLDSIAHLNQGRIYTKYDKPIYLMIDIKTEAKSTYKVLHKLLVNYASLFQTPLHNGAVKIFISGNRALNLILADESGLASVDGRPQDLGKSFSASQMPVISDSYFNVIKWDGTGVINDHELNTLKQLAQRVHAENKKLRLWASPDNENTWKTLLAAGVDFINTDKLAELNQFLKSQGK